MLYKFTVIVIIVNIKYGSCLVGNECVHISSSLSFETQEELNLWKSAFDVGISYALGDNEVCFTLFAG